MTQASELLSFQIVGTLGYGARSTIYAVKDGQGASFALKRVTRRSGEDARFLTQAIHEHEIASHFDHPNLRRTHKIIRQRKMFRVSEVLVLMELVEGYSLEQHQPKDLGELCGVMKQVASALGAMHEQGYVHADIKPNNIMVTRDGSVKLIDFGQSCRAGIAKERIQGTPDYIAPEQVKRRPLSPATDAFNLGATLYWLLTDKHVPTLIPRGTAGVTYRDQQQPTPPREQNPDVPPALSSLVMSCIQADPLSRPQSMGEVLNRLDLALAQLERHNSNSNGSHDI